MTFLKIYTCVKSEYIVVPLKNVDAQKLPNLGTLFLNPGYPDNLIAAAAAAVVVVEVVVEVVVVAAVVAVKVVAVKVVLSSSSSKSST